MALGGPYMMVKKKPMLEEAQLVQNFRIRFIMIEAVAIDRSRVSSVSTEKSTELSHSCFSKSKYFTLS